MKIKSLNIASFGGLKNKQIDFGDNFNIVYGNNENGKTTIMNFVKMMFYGTERGSGQISKNLRKKYTPWDNSGMAGSIDFEMKGRNYRIERIFGSSNSTDKVTFIDLDLGEHKAVSADIGNDLFGLSCPAFERSVFVGQFGFPESNAIAEGEINSKLSNLTLTGDQTVSFDEINKRLYDAKTNLTTKRGVGLYDKNVTAYRELTDKLNSLEQLQQTLNSKQENAEQINGLIENLKAKYTELKEKIDGEKDFKNAQKLQELLLLKEKLNTLNQSLKLSDGKLIDEMFLRKIEFCLSKIKNSEQKATAKIKEIEILQNNLDLALNPSPDMTPERTEQLKQKVANLEKEQSQINSDIERLEYSPKPKNTLFLIMLILGLSLCGIGIGIIILKTVLLGGALTAVGLISVIIAFILKINAKGKISKNDKELLDLKLKQNQLISLIVTEKANLNAINTAINSNATMIENQKQRLKECKNELEFLKEEKQTNTDNLFKAYAPYKTVTDIEEIRNSLEDIREKALTQKEIKQNINYILRDVGNISYEEARLKLEKLQIYKNNIDFEFLKQELEQTSKQLTEKVSEFATLNTEIKTIKENTANIQSIKAKLNRLQETIESQKEYCDALDIASSVLAESFVEVRRSFGSVLEKRASDIFKGITNGQYQNMSISKSFEIAVEKADVFGSKEIDYLSNGTADQAYLSLRLAICELIGQTNGRLPILLDDALAQYDDTRTKTALEFLKEYSKEGQIILFTCHNSILNASDANKIIL